MNFRILLFSVLTILLTNCGGSDGGAEIPGVRNDSLNPSLTVLSMSIANGDATVSVSETVAINIETDEAILAPTVTLNGNPATTINGSGQNWQATYVVRTSDVMGVTSSLSINVDIVDILGNAGTSVSQTTDGSSVIVDDIIIADIDIQVSKGPVAGASCSIRDSDGNLIFEALTNQTGFIFETLNNAPPMISITCTGGAYIDEATGRLVEAGNLMLRTARSFDINDAGNLINIVATPLTEIAYQLAMVDGDIMDFNEQAAMVAQQFGLGSTNIAETVPASTLSGESLEGSAGTYGVILAAISQAVASEIADENSAATETIQTLMSLIDRLENDVEQQNTMGDAIVDIIDAINVLAESDVSAGVNITPTTVTNLFPTLSGESMAFAVFDGSIGEVWDSGIQAFSADLNFSTNCTNGGSNCDSIAWTIITAEDASRGEVIEFTHAVDGEFSGAFIGSSSPVNLSTFVSGDIVFDINVTNSGTGNGSFIIQIDCANDCGSGRYELTESEGYVIGTAGWQTVTVPVSRITDGTGNPFFNTTRLTPALLNMVTTGIVLYPNAEQQSGVVFQLDNVRWLSDGITSLSGNVGGGSGGDGTSATDNGSIFVNTIDAQWDNGIQAFSADTNFSDNCTDGGSNCPSIAWGIIDADDVERGQVIEVKHTEEGMFSGAFIGASIPVNFSSFANGNVVFDINVTNAGTGNGNFIIQVDCANNCSSGRYQLNTSEGFTPGATGWQTVTVPVSRVTDGTGNPFFAGTRLSSELLSTVTAGLVLFPDADQQSGVVFRLDNVRWENGDSSEPEPMATPTPVPSASVNGSVFVDAIDEQWDNGIQAFSADTDFLSNCTDGGSNCSSIAWEIVAADDTSRGQVIQVSHTADGMFSGIFIGSSDAIDFSSFANGTITFDINVIDQGVGNAGTFDIQIGCGQDCGSGRFNLEASEGFVAGTSGWQTVSVAVSRITGGTGMPFVPPTRLVEANLSAVFSGLDIFPTEEQQSGIVFQLDNIRWEGAEVPVVEGSSASFRLAFSEDFDGSDLNTATWNIATNVDCPFNDNNSETIPCGWGNQELQLYRQQNITVADGMLMIEGRREDINGDSTLEYTSARINTQNKVDFTYGRVEVRAQLPGGAGTWPAIWMLPTDDIYGVWPRSGEIDIMEAGRNGTPNTEISSAIHFNNAQSVPNSGTVCGLSCFISQGTNVTPVPSTSFHTYALEWIPGELRFFVDDVQFESLTQAEWNSQNLTVPFDQAFHVLLNFAIGGAFPSAVDSSVFPQTFMVDYVRIYCMDVDSMPADHCIRSGAAPTPTGLPVDFSTGFQGVSDFGGAQTITAVDPDDANNRVLRTTKTNGAETYAGSSVNDVNQPFVFASGSSTVITVDVLAPEANIPVLLKVEYSGDSSTQFRELIANTTQANQWDTLRFDFGDLSSITNFDRLVVFFDFGTAGEGTVFLWDNIQLESSN